MVPIFYTYDTYMYLYLPISSIILMAVDFSLMLFMYLVYVTAIDSQLFGGGTIYCSVKIVIELP